MSRVVPMANISRDIDDEVENLNNTFKQLKSAKPPPTKKSQTKPQPPPQNSSTPRENSRQPQSRNSIEDEVAHLNSTFKFQKPPQKITQQEISTRNANEVDGELSMLNSTYAPKKPLPVPPSTYQASISNIVPSFAKSKDIVADWNEEDHEEEDNDLSASVRAPVQRVRTPNNIFRPTNPNTTVAPYMSKSMSMVPFKPIPVPHLKLQRTTQVPGFNSTGLILPNINHQHAELTLLRSMTDPPPVMPVLPVPGGMEIALSERSKYTSHILDERINRLHDIKFNEISEDKQEADQKLVKVATEAIKIKRMLQSYTEPERRKKAKAIIQDVYRDRHINELSELLLRNFQESAAFLLQALTSKNNMSPAAAQALLTHGIHLQHTDRILKMQWRHRTEIRGMFKSMYTDEDFQAEHWYGIKVAHADDGIEPELLYSTSSYDDSNKMKAVRARNAHNFLHGIGQDLHMMVKRIDASGLFTVINTEHAKVEGKESKSIRSCVGSEFLDWLVRSFLWTKHGNDPDFFGPVFIEERKQARNRAFQIAQTLYDRSVFKHLNMKKQNMGFLDGFHFYSFHPQALGEHMALHSKKHLEELENYTSMAVAWAAQMHEHNICRELFNNPVSPLQQSIIFNQHLEFIMMYRQMLRSESEMHTLENGLRDESPTQILLSHKKQVHKNPYTTNAAYPKLLDKQAAEKQKPGKQHMIQHAAMESK